jgi:hypothetical protein
MSWTQLILTQLRHSEAVHASTRPDTSLLIGNDASSAMMPAATYATSQTQHPAQPPVPPTRPDEKVTKQSLYKKMSGTLGRLAQRFGSKGTKNKDKDAVPIPTIESTRQYMRTYSKRSGFYEFPAESVVEDIWDATYRKYATIGATPVRRSHRPSFNSYYRATAPGPSTQRNERRG